VILADIDYIVADNKPGTPRLAKALNGSHGVTAIALLNDQPFVTRDEVVQVSIYNSTSLQLQSQLTFTGLGAHIHGLATCTTHNYLYISDYNSHCIHRVDLSIAGANTLIKWNVHMTYPYGLSVNSARNVLVAFYFHKKVQEYTPTGSFVREIVLSDNNQPYQAVELSSGIIAVSYGNGVSKISMETNTRHSYGNQAGSGIGQMSNTRGMSVDKQGYILVADYNNNKILVVNPSLIDARQLPLAVETALEKPWPLVLDQSRGRLYVGEYHGGQKRLLAFDNITDVAALFNKY